MKYFFAMFLPLLSWAGSASENVYGPVRLIERTYQISLADCLAALPAAAPTEQRNNWFCNVELPAQSFGLTWYADAAAVSKELYGTGMPMVGATVLPTPRGVKVDLAITRTNPATGLPYTFSRTDAVREIELLFKTRNISARSYRVLLLQVVN